MQQFADQLRPGLRERRARRVLLRVPVVIRGCHSNATPFEEQTHTLVVSENGALILLAVKVERGQTLHLMHKITGQEQDCHVVYIGPKQGDKTEIAVEFTHPTQQFWRIDFPPEGYKAPAS